ncbi:hypothetical protein DFH28DRAFT_1001077 [Melampsora americana]|nr:hypothetical protein DFH28DRAFT_1001077 [Melampsora americana]
MTQHHPQSFSFSFSSILLINFIIHQIKTKFNSNSNSISISNSLYLFNLNLIKISTLLLLFNSTSISIFNVNAQSQPLPCQRWAQQTTISITPNSNSNQFIHSNSTLWIQGGQIKSSPDQINHTWTNALLSLDLNTPWNAGSPHLNLIIKDNSNPYFPPSVSLGSLWSSNDGQSLYQWGGQFADNPIISPGPMNPFKFDLQSLTWSSINPKGDQVLRASEGASALVPNLKDPSKDHLGYYFGGHLDWASVPNWSNLTPRVFLDSILEFDLSSSSWKNYSSFAPSSVSGFNNATTESSPTIRADGTLTYVPSIGTNAKGALVSIGGGQNFQSTTQNSNRSIDNSALDVFDLETKSWVKQATQGDIPPPRVNHCAVRGTAKVNGEPQHQIFVYGGQIVNGSSQSTDLYVLSIPGFIWTFVGDRLNSQPSARAGHTCDLIGSQMIVIGGYVASDLLCDSQSVYVFDTTSLSWQSSYKPGLPYRTPDRFASKLGGTGIGYSTSSAGSCIGGDGSNDKDMTIKYKSSTSNSSRLGSIVGGVLGSLVGLFIILLILLLLRKRRKAQERERDQLESLEREKIHSNSSPNPDRAISASYFGSDLGGMIGGSIGSRDEMSQHLFHQYYPAASDDPEHDTEGFEPQFSTRLVPRQALRVMNPENSNPIHLPHET